MQEGYGLVKDFAVCQRYLSDIFKDKVGDTTVIMDQSRDNIIGIMIGRVDIVTLVDRVSVDVGQWLFLCHAIILYYYV